MHHVLLVPVYVPFEIEKNRKGSFGSNRTGRFYYASLFGEASLRFVSVRSIISRRLCFLSLRLV